MSRAEILVRAQRARLFALEQQVILDAVDAYTAAFRDQVVLDLALNNEERLTRQLEATRDRFEVGEVARTDVAQAEARPRVPGPTSRPPRPTSPARARSTSV